MCSLAPGVGEDCGSPPTHPMAHCHLPASVAVNLGPGARWAGQPICECGSVFQPSSFLVCPSLRWAAGIVTPLPRVPCSSESGVSLIHVLLVFVMSWVEFLPKSYGEVLTLRALGSVLIWR